MVMIKNAAPQANLLGIRDASGRPPQVVPELLPTHLPHVFIYAERGPLTPQLVVGDSAVRTYGAKSFDYRGPYANHQTVLFNTLNERANACFVQRIRPTDAPGPATIRLSLDLLKDSIPEYVRNLDGSVKLDELGKPIPTGETVEGYIGKWVIGVVSDGMGQARPVAGTQVSQAGEQSTLYPWWDLEVSSFGAHGNLKGMRLWAPNTRSAIPVDEDTIADQMAYLYRIQFVERPDEKSVANVLQTKFGEQYVDFSFKEGAINRRVDTELFVDEVVLQAYQDLDRPGEAPLYGPFGGSHVYHDQIDEVLQSIFELEVQYGNLPSDEEAKHMINVLSATDHDGNPYHSFIVKSPVDGGILFTEQSTHYAAGGGDGTMSFELFDELVRNQMANYGDLPGYDFLNTAVYPTSVYYDTGFTIETKKALLTAIGRRKDVAVVLSTQDVSDRPNTASEESSMAIALRTAARMYPESEIYGTKTCRAIVVGQCGYLINSKYKGLLPLTIELAAKCAEYMGASNGIWKSGYGFDIDPMNRVSMFRDVNVPFKPSAVRNRDWDNGLVWAQSYDRRSLFFPGIQTVYDDDSSVLNSAMNMFIAIELQKVAERTWRRLTGVSSLTAGQFIERSNEIIEEQVAARFDNRVIVEAETFYTGADENRGYSWSCNIHMYANNMKTVGNFTIVAHRREDYEA